MSDPLFLPAVGYYWSSARRVEELDLADKSKQSGGVAGNAVVRPTGEMKLTDLTDVMIALLYSVQREW